MEPPLSGVGSRVRCVNRHLEGSLRHVISSKWRPASPEVLGLCRRTIPFGAHAFSFLHLFPGFHSSEALDYALCWETSREQFPFLH